MSNYQTIEYGRRLIQSWDAEPWRFFNWLEMHEFSAKGFMAMVQSVERLNGLASVVLLGSKVVARTKDQPYQPQPIAQEHREMITGALRDCVRECHAIGFAMSVHAACRILYEIEKTDKATMESLKIHLPHLQNAILEEMESPRFFYISPKQQEFWARDDKISPLGETVLEAFPSVRSDSCAAGKALAVGLPTAAVFHLMRALESGLILLGKEFGIALDSESWGRVLPRIEDAVNRMGNDPNKAGGWRERQIFFSQAVAHFITFKNAWRNYVSHGHQEFTSAGAEKILNGVMAFMLKLAEELKEPPPPPP